METVKNALWVNECDSAVFASLQLHHTFWLSEISLWISGLTTVLVMDLQIEESGHEAQGKGF